MSSLIQQLEDTFSSFENFTPERFQSLMQETVKTLQGIQTKVKSKDPKEVEEGVAMALQLKRALKEQSEALCRKVGMTPEQLSQFVQNSDNFSKSEWDALGLAKQGVEAFNQQIQTKPADAEKAARTPKKKTKFRLGG